MAMGETISNRNPAYPQHPPMTNFIRSIHSISNAPAPHGNLHQLLRTLFLLICAAASTATAQVSKNYSPSSGSSNSSGDSMVVVVVVLFATAFIMLFFSVYLRRCNSNAATSGGDAAARPWPPKPGLDPEVIDSFPIIHYSDAKGLKFGKGGGTLGCAVCISEFENDDALRLLPKCDHVFHPECIDAWLASHSTCPVCRANLTPSKKELGQMTGSSPSIDLDRAPSQNQSQNQNQDQIAIDVEERGNREVHASELPKRKLVPRSQSTGHSVSHPGKDLERYTLRLPVELKRELMSRSSGSLKRTISCVIISPTEASSRSGGGEGSSKGQSDRWVFSMTPPVLASTLLVAPPKVGFEGG